MAAPQDIDDLKNVMWRRRTQRRLLDRDGFLCWLCGKIMVQEDATIHPVALTAGGGDELGHLVLCHASCHKRLGNRPPDQKVRMREKRRRSPPRRRRPARKS